MFFGKISFWFFLGLKRAGLFLENVALVIGRSILFELSIQNRISRWQTVLENEMTFMW